MNKREIENLGIWILSVIVILFSMNIIEHKMFVEQYSVLNATYGDIQMANKRDLIMNSLKVCLSVLSLKAIFTLRK